MSVIESSTKGYGYDLVHLDWKRQTPSFSTIPAEIIKKIIFFDPHLSIERQEELIRVNHQWYQIICTSEIWKIGVFEKLLRFFPSVQVFDKYKWEEIFDLESEGLIVEDFPPFEIPQLKKLKELFSSMCQRVEWDFGVTLLTIPQNLKLNKLVQLSESSTSPHRVFFPDFPRSLSFFNKEDPSINKTYRILISNAIYKGTRNLSFNQHAEVDSSFISKLPSFLEVACLLATTQSRLNRINMELYGNPLVAEFTFCSFEGTWKKEEYIGVAAPFSEQGQPYIQLTAIKKNERKMNWGARQVCRLSSLDPNVDPKLFPEEPRSYVDLSLSANSWGTPLALRKRLRDIDYLNRFTHFDHSDWKKFFDISIDKADLLPFDTPTCSGLRALLSSLPPIESLAGVTLLTMPKGLTLSHLIEGSKILELESTLKILHIWEGIRDNLLDEPILKTYRIAITNHVFSDSWGLSSVEQKDFMDDIQKSFIEQGGQLAHFRCRIPKVIEVAFLIFVMHVKSHYQFYYMGGQPLHFARCSEQIGGFRTSVGNFSTREGFQIGGVVLEKIRSIGFGGVIELPSISKADSALE